MATITSTKSGLASDPTVWSGGVVPVEGDKVIIAAGHVVTLDGTFTWGDDNTTATIGTAAISVSGTLKASRSTSSSLTVRGLLFCNYGTHAIDFGTDADPIPAGVTTALILNKHTTPSFRTGLWQQTASNNTAAFTKWTFVGDTSRKRGVYLAVDALTSSANITVSDASHGWQVGDELLFFTTTNNTTTNECEVRIIAAIDGGDARNITLSSATTYVHKAGSPAANLTCNVVVKSYNEVNGQNARITFSVPGYPQNATLGYTFIAKGVDFRSLGGASAAEGMINTGNQNSSFSTIDYKFHDCVFYSTLNSGSVFCQPPAQYMDISRCVVRYSGVFAYQGSPASIRNSFIAIGYMWNSAGGSWVVEDTWITGVSAATLLDTSGTSFTRLKVSGTGHMVVAPTNIGNEFTDCDLGYTFGWKSFYGTGQLTALVTNAYATANIKLANCSFDSEIAVPASSESLMGEQSEKMRFEFINKNQDTTQQEIYTSAGYSKRSNTEAKRSTSSVQLKCFALGKPNSKSQQILCANGATIRIVGYVKMDAAFYNGGTYTAPTVSLSGLGATPVTFAASAAANNAWEKYDISITNSSGADGSFTLTYTVEAQAVTTGMVYFDGVPDAPFVTKCRHYGFRLPDESLPTRVVDVYVSADEATAAAYTGVTINGTTKRISFGAGTADTSQKFYDYTRAWACLNLDKDIPLTRAGALYSLTDGWTVVGSTYAGLTWGGGTVEFSTPGTINQSFDSCDIRFTAGGTYAMGGSVFAGTVEFINTSGSPVTVQIPAGVSYVNTGPSITIELPTSDVDITAAALISGSRVRLYNVTDATEIYNAVLPSTGLVHTLTYSADKVVVLRADHATKLPLEVAGVLTASGLTFLDVQQEDVVYVGNAIDGTTVSEFTADEPNIEVDIDDLDGATSFRRVYAWMQHYFTTEAGIRSSMFGAVTAIDSGTYVINVAKANILLDNAGVLPVAFMNGDRLIRSDGTSVIAPTSGTIHIDSGFVPVVETGVSGLTATESERLLALDTTYLDAPVSSRLAAASYTAPDNAGIADIDAKTDALATLVADVVDGVEASTVLAKEATAAKAMQNAALGAALAA